LSDLLTLTSNLKFYNQCASVIDQRLDKLSNVLRRIVRLRVPDERLARAGTIQDRRSTNESLSSDARAIVRK
jgi:hypothetical protein